jgi:hypothetical protein
MSQKRWIVLLLIAAALSLAAVTWVIVDDARSEAPQTEQTAPTEAMTDASVEPPTVPATEAPTVPPTEAPTEPTTEAPTEPTTEAPTEAPTEPTTEATEPTQPKERYEFAVYSDTSVNYSDIAYMGSDNGGNDGSITIDPQWTDNPHSGAFCTKVIYAPTNTFHWAGALYLSGAQNFPPNLPVTGVDVSRAKQLSFWARGTGSTKFYIEDDKGNQAELVVTLTADWQQYTIDVPDVWQTVCVGFAFVSNSDDVGGGVGEFYLDDIMYSE